MIQVLGFNIVSYAVVFRAHGGKLCEHGHPSVVAYFDAFLIVC